MIALPWWARIGSKLVLSRLPFGYAIWQRLGLFRHGAMDQADYAVRVFAIHAERSGLAANPAGKTVLELGPGDSVSTAVIAAAHGASAILVDTGAFVRDDLAPYVQLTDTLTQMGLTPPDVRGVDGLAALLERCRSRYLTDGLESLRSLESQSVDYIFSQAVLEHVRRDELLPMMRECRRVLKPGGVCSHQIDLRDHLGGGLNNLRFRERVWESPWFARSGFYTNRLQYSTMLRMFREAGFNVRVTGVRRWDALPTPRRALAEQFRACPDEELCVAGFEVVLA